MLSLIFSELNRPTMMFCVFWLVALMFLVSLMYKAYQRFYNYYEENK